MKPTHYMLINGEIVKTNSLTEWVKWHETAERRVAFTDLGDCQISTVFLGLDHGFNSPHPVLFETMVFHAETGDSIEMDRCCTLDEAMEMHDAMVSRILARGVVKPNG